MICPRCKKQIPNETINCPHCNMKIGSICKHCGAYNLINNKACIECGTDLVKFCPDCKAANFPNASHCRKCGYSFKSSKAKQTNDKSKILHPRQFVLPEIKADKKRKKTVIKNIQTPNIKPTSKQLSGEPLLPEKMLLQSNEKILSNHKISKKITNSSKPVTKKRKLIKRVKKKITPENTILQNQLTTLQGELNGLKEQLKILPQQLNQMNLQKNIAEQNKNNIVPKTPVEKDTQENQKTDKKADAGQQVTQEIQNIQDIIKGRPKSSQRSVIPKKLKIQNENRIRNKQFKRSIIPEVKNSMVYKGITPFKSNVLPNRRNIIPAPVNPKQVKRDIFPKPQKELKISEPKANENLNIKEVSNNLEYSPNLFTQQSAKNILVNTLLNTSVSIISLSGASGIGKNIVLRSAIESLKENQFVWLIGKATPLSQITPCGLFQDILLTFFNVPNFCVNTEKLRKDSFKFFKTEFPTLKNDETDDLINFLYPEKSAYYENIFKNKKRTFSILRKVFNTITSRMQTVFVFDNFEHVDNMSYEFLKTLINSKTGLQNTKFILTYNEPKSAKTYLYDKSLDDSHYADISLISFNNTQTDTFINQYNPLFIGTSRALRETIHEQTNGNPAYIEQILNLVTDSSRNYVQFNLPDSFEEVVRRRLVLLKQENVIIYEMLIAASILGLKFYPVILNQLFKIDDKSFVELFSSLLDLNYITPVNESAYEFKSTMLWQTIYSLAKKDKSFNSVNEKLFIILSSLTLSSHSSLALIATNLKENLSALNAWSEVVRQSAAIGDENIYIIAQKYSLVLVDKLQGVNSSLIKNNIFERLGKILSFNNPKAAIEYLPRVIEHVRRLDDNLKEFELTGYLAQCCHKMGNQYGVIECIDNAVANVDKSYDLEIAMLLSRKLNPLLEIGNFGELAELIDGTLLPIFEKNLDTSKHHKNVKIEDLFETWLQTYLIYANSLVLQGDNRSIGIISTIFEIVAKNHIQNELYICKTKLALALANTIKGDIKESEVILNEILSLYKNNDVMDVQAMMQWNFISVLNSISRNKLDNIQDELFQIVTFANNNNDVYMKNILKLLLGKVLKEKGKFKQAISIYSQQVEYFAKEKNALGVLISWYFISEITLLTAGPEKSLEYSLKALDIAQSPKIQNYYFITQFNKIIGEAYLACQDYDSAKAYIESAIGIARQFDLLDILSELYFLYGKYLQELAGIKSKSQKDYANSAFKMYDKAVNLAQGLHNTTLVGTIMSANTELRRYCQKNGIIIR